MLENLDIILVQAKNNEESLEILEHLGWLKFSSRGAMVAE